MSALYYVKFKSGKSVYVSSADAKSNKRQDIKASYKKARDKAAKKLFERPADCVACKCVG